ncbi:glucoside xylosyltransferase 1-like isoform X4 [Gymnodraco acuticeps]|uniref:Glucoside xylosyltransferase 1 n=1 Tax=Gymnodraco acuticeps TaxID=8218 RepID=A0A6P8UCL9_GYMAC|nr:glucoside xylosyltransferase 1-like isoform X4 [Gymnodraco acuticeps]
MRCYLQAFLLCMVFIFFSLVYVFNQLASTLEDRDGWGLKEQGIPGGRSHDDGHLLRKRPGLAGRDHEEGLDRERSSSPGKHHGDERSHVAVVACGTRLEETLTMLKSAVLLSKKPLHFYVFAEDDLHEPFKNALILKEVDSLLYVDTDIIFLQPVEDIWALLSQFDSSHLAAMAPEHEEPRIGWYNRFARHPYYGKTGINSGVMLMNMTRLREKYFKNDMTTVPLKWEEILMPLLQKYKLNITWGDQDLLNIIFHHNPESLYVFPCQWNYRPDHCIYGSNCQQADQEGVFILHGNRGVYHNDKQPAFRAVYEAIQKYPFGENMETSLLQPLEASLLTTTNSYCGRASHLFTKKLKQSILSVQQEVTQRR